MKEFIALVAVIRRMLLVTGCSVFKLTNANSHLELPWLVSLISMCLDCNRLESHPHQDISTA